MDLNQLEQALKESGATVRGAGGIWEVTVDDLQMTVVTDPRFDRMRIVAPITNADQVTNAQREAMLEANFQTAIDARYATNKGILYASYVHPLKSLVAGDIESALKQVASLVRTFGSTYSSGTVIFG